MDPSLILFAVMAMMIWEIKTFYSDDDEFDNDDDDDEDFDGVWRSTRKNHQ